MNYDDIINLPHHVSTNHKPMSKEARAAQFAPFAALTGYNDALKETSRLTDKRQELSEEEKDVINQKLQIINDNIKTKPLITITYFISDKTKSGGSYQQITNNIKKIDINNAQIVLVDNQKVSINDIFDIKSDILKDQFF